jgi:hypothetical protein
MDVNFNNSVLSRDPFNISYALEEDKTEYLDFLFRQDTISLINQGLSRILRNSTDSIYDEKIIILKTDDVLLHQDIDFSKKADNVVYKSFGKIKDLIDFIVENYQNNGVDGNGNGNSTDSSTVSDNKDYNKEEILLTVNRQDPIEVVNSQNNTLNFKERQRININSSTVSDNKDYNNNNGSTKNIQTIRYQLNENDKSLPYK